MRENQVLHLLGVDLFPAAVDKVFFSSLNHQVAARMQADNVPGAIESIGSEGELVMLLCPVVPANGVRTTREEFPDFSYRGLMSAIVYDPDFVTRRDGAALRLRRRQYPNQL